jgi:hypothetical protein
MPWKIIEAEYDPTDGTTLHDDELIAIERALSEALGRPENEFNPRWRAREKLRVLAERCTGRGDPVHLLPPGAGASPVRAEYPSDPHADPPRAQAPGTVRPRAVKARRRK